MSSDREQPQTHKCSNVILTRFPTPMFKTPYKQMKNINNCLFLIYFFSILRFQHLQIFSIIDFICEKIELFLPKSQLSLKHLLQSFWTYLRTVDITFVYM